ncbi:hypothetical protein BKA81DRAFT_191067 [Phyllosticta paracitricarpa]|uniref:Uncharacterized protein n=1 Tax=Phyllosticta paracitricarpa TaxID=2016321 RepID=A0ABR1NC44_9PEZI
MYICRTTPPYQSLFLTLSLSLQSDTAQKSRSRTALRPTPSLTSLFFPVCHSSPSSAQLVSTYLPTYIPTNLLDAQIPTVKLSQRMARLGPVQPRSKRQGGWKVGSETSDPCLAMPSKKKKKRKKEKRKKEKRKKKKSRRLSDGVKRAGDGSLTGGLGRGGAVVLLLYKGCEREEKMGEDGCVMREWSRSLRLVRCGAAERGGAEMWCAW